MAWRFAPSKFKNTTPKLPKKEDTVFDLPIGNLSVTNNGIQASHKHVAFCIDGEGGKLGVVPVGAKGRRLRKDISVVCAHGEQVDDFNFMTFNDDLLVTCSRDERIKMWRLGAEGADPILESDLDLGNGSLLGSLMPHSTASGLVAYTSTEKAFVVDWETQSVACELDGIIEKGLSCSWSDDGKMLASTCDKGRVGLVWDPRAGPTPVHTLELHSGMGREARILFAGDKLVSSGFTNKRVQEVRIFDTLKYGAPVHSEEFTATTGLLIPLYDPDTKLLFLGGKGTNKLVMTEIQTRSPILSRVFELSLPDQLLGACLGNKRSVSVMEGEVQTFYELTKNSILPLPCIVPRRSYRDFHSDLYPDTRGPVAGCSAMQWISGTNSEAAKVSLAPAGVATSTSPTATAPAPRTIPQEPASRAPAAPQIAFRPPSLISHPSEDKKQVNGSERPIAEVRPTQKVAEQTREDSPSHEKENLIVEPKKQPAEPDVPRMRLKTTDEPCAGRRPITRARPKSCVVGQIASKFRHVEVLAGIKANNSVFSNLRNVNTRLPPEANGICVSNKWIALPLSGPAGIISILDVNEPCKLPDGVMDGIFNKSQVTDLQWNPFNENELACGTDCGAVNIWKLSAEDGPRNEMEPERVIRIGGEKIVALRWHPLVSDLMAIALSDASVELWNVKDGSQLLKIPAHDQAILGIAWSAFGHKLATVGKDLMVRVFEPQRGENCLVAESKCLESPRSARILFACDDQLIVVVGFTKSSSRKVQLYDADSLKLIHTEMLDNAVQPLVPYYDFDTSVMFLTGKGDRTVVMYEVCVDSPYLLPLSSFICPSGHQALAFHNKTKCNVMSVEFQRAWKLTDKTIELLIFRVPRVKKDVFQADLFPDALVTWTPSISVEEYANGKDFTPQFQCLKPDGVHSTGGSGATAPRLARMSQFAPSASPAAAASKSEEKQETTPAAPALAPPSSAAVNVPSPITEADESTSTIRSPTPNDPAHTVDNVNGGEHAHTSSPTSASASANPSQTSTEGAVAASGDASSSSARSASTTTVVDRDAVQELGYGKAVYGKAPLADMDEDEVKKEVLTSWSDRITVDKSLEQEHMEGVAEEEWIDD